MLEPGDPCDAAGGLLRPKETCKRWTGRKSPYDRVFRTLEDACEQFFAPFPMIKQSHVAGNTGCRIFEHYHSQFDLALNLW